MKFRVCVLLSRRVLTFHDMPVLCWLVLYGKLLHLLIKNKRVITSKLRSYMLRIQLEMCFFRNIFKTSSLESSFSCMLLSFTTLLLNIIQNQIRKINGQCIHVKSCKMLAQDRRNETFHLTGNKIYRTSYLLRYFSRCDCFPL